LFEIHKFPLTNIDCQVEFIVTVFTERPQPQPISTSDFDGFTSPAFRYTLETIKKVALSDSHIILEGEAGLNKLALGKFIHSLSKQTGGFYSIDLRSITDQQLLWNVFDDPGHNLWAKGHGGTLLFEHVRHSSTTFQERLVAYLAQQEDHVRVILTLTNSQENNGNIGINEFLYYFPNIIKLQIPPLRHRKDDIPVLVQKTLEHISRRTKTKIKSLDSRAMNFLQHWSWPGNIKELTFTIESAVSITTSDIIRVEDLDRLVATKKRKTEDREMKTIINEVTKVTVKNRLAAFSYNHTHTAKSLGITRQRLLQILKQYKIKDNKQ
jgi:DNA-binding NtrC family response regulator